MIDFSLNTEFDDLRLRVRDFVEKSILPLESDSASHDDHENIRMELLENARGQAKTAELPAPQAPGDRGSLGLPIVGWTSFYEEANRSIFGSACFNCSAPDDGHISVLNKVGTENQKKRWLQPIIDGQVRSAFAMTEPGPGGGSDPISSSLTASLRSNVFYQPMAKNPEFLQTTDPQGYAIRTKKGYGDNA